MQSVKCSILCIMGFVVAGSSTFGADTSCSPIATQHSASGRTYRLGAGDTLGHNLFKHYVAVTHAPRPSSFTTVRQSAPRDVNASLSQTRTQTDKNRSIGLLVRLGQRTKLFWSRSVAPLLESFNNARSHDASGTRRVVQRH